MEFLIQMNRRGSDDSDSNACFPASRLRRCFEEANTVVQPMQSLSLFSRALGTVFAMLIQSLKLKKQMAGRPSTNAVQR